jgi:hypothetical protein
MPGQYRSAAFEGVMSLGKRKPAVHSYQMGGMIGAGGAPEPTGVGLQGMPQGGMPQGGMPQGGMPQGGMPQGGMPQGGMPPEMLEMHVNQFMSQHPQQVEEVRQAMLSAMQSGELDQQELNMVVQLATVALQNPEMYSSVRNFALQQGIATEQDLPQQYDQGLVFVLLLAARAIQADSGGQGMMQSGSPQMAGGGGVPSMAVGGEVPQSKKNDGSVLIQAHEGEYVIPENVVKMKGREFFDNLVEKYKK